MVLVDEIKSTLAQKLELSALSPIWKHFDRFALYEDLKILHNKVMPEIQKFEERLISCDRELQKTSMIIQQFDNHMAQKANKVAIRDFQTRIEDTYATKTEVKENL